MSISTACHCDFRSWGKRVVQIYACVYSFYANGEDLQRSQVGKICSQCPSSLTGLVKPLKPQRWKSHPIQIPQKEPHVTCLTCQHLKPAAAEVSVTFCCRIHRGRKREGNSAMADKRLHTFGCDLFQGGKWRWLDGMDRAEDRGQTLQGCVLWYMIFMAIFLHKKENFLKNPHPELIARSSDTRNQHWTTIDTPRKSACLISGHWESATGVACCLLTAGVSLSLWKTLVALDSVRYRKEILGD